MAGLVASEVKGIWFVATREYALEVHGQRTFEQLLDQTPQKFRDVYAAPITSAWYPEEALQEVLSILHELVAQGNDARFERIVEGCTEKGIHRLFQMLLRVSSPGFVLRMVPTMWRQLRRGAGHVDVEQHEGHAIVRYSEFPWFNDRLYRILTTGSLRAVVRGSAPAGARIEVLDHGRDSLVVRIAYHAQESYPPPVRHVSTRPAMEAAAASIGPARAHSSIESPRRAPGR
jgi:hypothetical protein